jgi:hypothetical protein
VDPTAKDRTGHCGTAGLDWLAGAMYPPTALLDGGAWAMSASGWLVRVHGIRLGLNLHIGK